MASALELLELVRAARSLMELSGKEDTQVIEQGQAIHDRVENVKLETLVTESGSSLSSLPDEHINQQNPEIKHRKKYKRKFIENRETCVIRGVYYKNSKWQAAIKVDKKQIHLGTVGSEEEAARLYDRAAFMCRRETNFELPEEDKKELRKYKWDEFVAMTRFAIKNKKSQKTMGSGNRTSA